MQSPTLAAITFDETGGGIAVVSNLLWQAFVARWGLSARRETVFDHQNRPATAFEKARFVTRIAQVQIRGDTDWIMFSHLALAQAQQLIPRGRRRRYGVFLHGIEAWNPLSRRATTAVAEADIRIANSRFTAERVMEQHPEVGYVETCPLALPPAGTRATVHGLPVQMGRHAVLVVGRMSQAERYKGHDQLIEAWPAVVACIPDAQLVIVGNGDDAARLREKAAPLSRNGIVFTGFVSQPVLDTLYERAAIFALPSEGEGFGLVYLEAMSHRLACIGSRQDAASEIIVDGETGRLVQANDRAELADALIGLLLDERRRRAMGEAGARREATEYAFDRFTNRLYALLDHSERNRQG